MFERLRQTLPKTLVDSHDFSIYNPNLVFENNIRGKRTVWDFFPNFSSEEKSKSVYWFIYSSGLYPAYVTEVAKLRIYCHLKFAFVKFDVIKITKHEEDSTVKVRWRISGMTGTRVLFTFWRYKLWEMKKMFDQQESCVFVNCMQCPTALTIFFFISFYQKMVGWFFHILCRFRWFSIPTCSW